MPSEKYVLGSGERLHWALAAWAEIEPETTLRPVHISQDEVYRFNLDALTELGSARQKVTAFVAWGPQFLNFRRLELMSEIKGRGLKMPPLICRGALIAPDVVIGENCVVAAGTIVGTGSKIGFNTVIGAGCIVGAAVQIASSAWIADGVQIGSNVRIANNATLGRGVILEDGITIGKQALLDLPGKRISSLREKTFINAAFPTPVEVVDYGAAEM